MKFKSFLQIKIVPIIYEWGKVEKVLGNKTGITIYSWTVWTAYPVFHDFWLSLFFHQFLAFVIYLKNYTYLTCKNSFLFRLSRMCSLEAFLICWTENWTWGVRIHLGEGQESLRGKILTARLPECLTLPQYVQFTIYFSNSFESIFFALHVINLYIYQIKK